MNYQEVMCKFCKECIGKNLKQYIIKSNDKFNSDTIAIRCDNYYSKDEFKSNIV